MAILTQFYLLQYKSWKLQFRKKLVTAVEILVPILLCLVMMAIRVAVKEETVDTATHYPSYSVDEWPFELLFSLDPSVNGNYGLGYTPKTPVTKRIMEEMSGNLDALGLKLSENLYHTEGFLLFQHALHKSILTILNPDWLESNVSVNLEQIPSPPYTTDTFITVIKVNLPFIIIICFIFLALQIPKEVTYEKQMKLKESMRMMGMANWLQWFSWYFKYFVFFFFITFFMSLILTSPAKFDVVMFAANVAAAAGGIIYFLSYVPFFFIVTPYENMSAGAKTACCLDFNLAMSIGMIIIGDAEKTDAGVQWGTLNQPPTVDDNFAFGEVLYMLFVDWLIHSLLLWYIDAVFPGDYGVAQPPYFFVLPSYWCGTKPETVMIGTGSKVDVEDVAVEKVQQFEPDPVNLTAGIQIKNLKKKFKSNGITKIAVNDVSLNMYEGQITALLGHNGAGKTTTMFMLTGFFPPTSGTAIINGYDIRKDLANVRSSLGLCPQHDILFDNLTVEEHFYFFAKLKHCPASDIKTQIDYYVNSLGLGEKRKEFAHTLSGGQKRKLSVGIALIGDSKVVILDEPTSGMDPSARRHMWDLLQSQRAGRTILLTTHFMDEADHLGDRIAILADGVVQCCGSSIFLKKRYGAGYHMVMTKDGNCDVSKVTELLQRHVPESKLEGETPACIRFCCFYICCCNVCSTSIIQ
ncbi:ABCA3 [Bugula neritina]|uniref:ABCA3 n=1 Tax=Bugula neritina TaxID=10212 RepID=A0A7J7IZ38_BUGNE|nr:ABCA3 [Bugula neritina]